MSHNAPATSTKDDAYNRRSFMQKTAALVGTLALPTIVPATAVGADGQELPSNRINLAQIGLGVMGRGHVRRLTSAPSVELLAVCDVDQTRLNATLATVEKSSANGKSAVMPITTTRKS